MEVGRGQDEAISVAVAAVEWKRRWEQHLHRTLRAEGVDCDICENASMLLANHARLMNVARVLEKKGSSCRRRRY